jgi:class 3 adenylate cyclase
VVPLVHGARRRAPRLEAKLGELHRYESTVNQFLEDGFMAMFGAPVAHEDHAARGVRAACRGSRHCGTGVDRTRVAPDTRVARLVGGHRAHHRRHEATRAGTCSLQPTRRATGARTCSGSASLTASRAARRGSLRCGGPFSGPDGTRSTTLDVICDHESLGP